MYSFPQASIFELQLWHFYQKKLAYEGQYVCIDKWKFQNFELWRRYRKRAICEFGRMAV